MFTTALALSFFVKQFLRPIFMNSLLFLLYSNYHQKLYKKKYLKHSCAYKNGKFANHNSEKLCLSSLALVSTIPALGFERMSLISTYLASNFFMLLVLASNVVSSTLPPLSTMSTKALGRMGPTCQIGSKKLILIFEPTLLVVIRSDACMNGSPALL